MSTLLAADDVWSMTRERKRLDAERERLLTEVVAPVAAKISALDADIARLHRLADADLSPQGLILNRGLVKDLIHVASRPGGGERAHTAEQAITAYFQHLCPALMAQSYWPQWRTGNRGVLPRLDAAKITNITHATNGLREITRAVPFYDQYGRPTRVASIPVVMAGRPTRSVMTRLEHDLDHLRWTLRVTSLIDGSTMAEVTGPGRKALTALVQRHRDLLALDAATARA